MHHYQDFNKNFIYTIYLIVISAVASFFIFDKSVSLSIMLGGATILWGMSQLAKQNKKRITVETTKTGRVSINYLLRFTLYAIVLVVSHYMSTLNVFGTLYGLSTFKIMLYAQAVFFRKKGGKSL